MSGTVLAKRKFKTGAAPAAGNKKACTKTRYARKHAVSLPVPPFFSFPCCSLPPASIDSLHPRSKDGPTCDSCNGQTECPSMRLCLLCDVASYKEWQAKVKKHQGYYDDCGNFVWTGKTPGWMRCEPEMHTRCYWTGCAAPVEYGPDPKPYSPTSPC